LARCYIRGSFLCLHSHVPPRRAGLRLRLRFGAVSGFGKKMGAEISLVSKDIRKTHLPLFVMFLPSIFLPSMEAERLAGRADG
jgi:hypothetical protein